MSSRVFHLIDDFAGDNYPDLLRCLAATDWDVHLGVIAGLPDQSIRHLEAEGVRIVRLPPTSRWQYAQLSLRLVLELRRRKIDILHAQLFDASIIGPLAAWVSRTPVRIVTRQHGELHHFMEKHLHVQLDRFSDRMAHHIVALSESNRRLLIDHEAVEPSKVSVISNGVRLDRFRNIRDADISAFRHELALNNDFVLTIPARLSEQKGQRYLVAALPTILAAAPRRISVLLVGEGPTRPVIEREAKRLGVTEAVRFLGFRRDIARVMAASDLVVLPSVMEPFGQVVVEAMALGRPVIATATGGPAEIITDGLDGLLIPTRSPRALAEAVIGIIEKPEFARRLGAEACKRAQDYDISKVAQRHDALYRRLLETQPSRSTYH